MNIRAPVYRQLLRYGVTGIASNAALYAIYLLLSSQGARPRTAMTCVYVLGVLATFVLNRQWTFGHAGAPAAAFLRYATIYALMYVLNMAALYLLVDQAGLPHEWVVLTLVFASAGVTFILQKYWVFRFMQVAAANRPVSPRQRSA